ncbi:MAG: DUF2946 domain-containing protein [Burkholderiaceae bacterium]|nr:DUF2946 domain-containing protein [Burkholderiaceae bacterium]
MMQLRQFRRRLAWVMLVTLVMASLAPGLSRAASALQGDSAPWSVVCTATSGSDEPQAPADAARHLLAHCPLCALHADGLGLPPPSPVLALPPASGQEVPAPMRVAPPLLPAWPAAQPRAPPRPA